MPGAAVSARVRPAALVLLGHPVAQSLSPLFQNAALAAAGLPVQYRSLDVPAAELDAVLDRLAREGAGGNVTLPYKEAVAARATVRSPLAEQVGAVNTFWFDNGALHGQNTDVAGIEASILKLRPCGVAGACCAVLGAGGSAAAVLVALQRMGAGEIRVWTRTAARASTLSARVGVPVTGCASASHAVSHASLVINTTPIGMHDSLLPVAVISLAPGTAVFDLVYRPDETAWVRAAREFGLPAMDGLHMLVEQGAAAFELWFGSGAPREAMWRALSDSIGRGAGVPHDAARALREDSHL